MMRAAEGRDDTNERPFGAPFLLSYLPQAELSPQNVLKKAGQGEPSYNRASTATAAVEVTDLAIDACTAALGAGGCSN